VLAAMMGAVTYIDDLAMKAGAKIFSGPIHL